MAFVMAERPSSSHNRVSDGKVKKRHKRSSRSKPQRNIEEFVENYNHLLARARELGERELGVDATDEEFEKFNIEQRAVHNKLEKYRKMVDKHFNYHSLDHRKNLMQKVVVDVGNPKLSQILNAKINVQNESSKVDDALAIPGYKDVLDAAKKVKSSADKETLAEYAITKIKESVSKRRINDHIQSLGLYKEDDNEGDPADNDEKLKKILDKQNAEGQQRLEQKEKELRQDIKNENPGIPEDTENVELDDRDTKKEIYYLVLTDDSSNDGQENDDIGEPDDDDVEFLDMEKDGTNSETTITDSDTDENDSDSDDDVMEQNEENSGKCTSQKTIETNEKSERIYVDGDDDDIRFWTDFCLHDLSDK